MQRALEVFVSRVVENDMKIGDIEESPSVAISDVETVNLCHQVLYRNIAANTIV